MSNRYEDSTAMRRALEFIEAGTELVFDEDVGREVEVWIDADDLREVARKALRDTSLTGGLARQKKFILLASGNRFDFLDPQASAFTIEDIAHGLSNICRFAGQCSRHYSVAQHSIHVSELLPPEYKLIGLLHDAAEAFIGDVPKPLKDLLPDFQSLEKRIEAVIFPRFGLSAELPDIVKDADMQMLATEQHQLMPDREGRSYAGGKAPSMRLLPDYSPLEARSAFLAEYSRWASSPISSPFASTLNDEVGIKIRTAIDDDQ